MEYLSKERYDEIVAEINFLINEEYPRIRMPWLRPGLKVI